MGIVNTTPDSFSDGGRFLDKQKAIDHAGQLIEQGADIIDVGGESTRPGADEVSLQQELDRVLPIIEALTKQFQTPVSIDTYKPEVMRQACLAGARMINDVNGLRAEGAMQVAAETGAIVCIMHMQGNPKTMQAQARYGNVVAEVGEFLSTQVSQSIEYGIERKNIVVDPGIGFGKSLHDNLRLLNAVSTLRSQLNCPILIGVSRKSMIDGILGRGVDERLFGGIGLAVQAVINGAKIIRVHDVEETFDAVRCVEAVAAAENPE